jgi:hypothetical protein
MVGLQNAQYNHSIIVMEELMTTVQEGFYGRMKYYVKLAGLGGFLSFTSAPDPEPDSATNYPDRAENAQPDENVSYYLTEDT